MRGVAGDHIHVVQQDDRTLRLARSCAAGAPTNRRVPGAYSNDAILDSFLIENLLEERHRLHFISRRIRRIDPQIFLHPCDRQIGILLQVLARESRAEASARRRVRVSRQTSQQQNTATDAPVAPSAINRKLPP